MQALVPPAYGILTIKYSADGQPMRAIGGIGNTDGLFLAEDDCGYSLEFLLDSVRSGSVRAKDEHRGSDHFEDYFNVMCGFSDRLPRACFAACSHMIRSLRKRGII